MVEPETNLEYIIRAKASMREYLRSKSWPEKVDSIARMNAAGKTARESMRQAMEQERETALRENTDVE